MFVRTVVLKLIHIDTDMAKGFTYLAKEFVVLRLLTYESIPFCGGQNDAGPEARKLPIRGCEELSEKSRVKHSCSRNLYSINGDTVLYPRDVKK